MLRPGRASVGSLRTVLLGVAVVISSTSCNPPSEQPDEAGDGDGDDPPPAGPPVILDLSEVVVDAAEREDITIAAADLLPHTRVEIDGRSWSLAELGPVLREGQILRVPLAGALVIGEHELVLHHQVGKQQLSSEALTIRVEAAELSPLLGSLEPEVLGAGDRLHDLGPGERLLGILDDAAEAVELRLDGWAAPGIVQALPGLAGAIDLAIVEHEQGRWLITTWLAEGGQRARARITPIDLNDPIGGDEQLGEPGELLELWSLADPEQRDRLGPHEVAINRGVALLDRRVVIAVEARRDAERQSPGDHLLVTRWLGLEGEPTGVELLRGPGGRDLDLPGRALLLLDRGASDPVLSVRLARAYPWLLELAGNGLPVLTGDPGETAGDLHGAPLWMASVDGALGSRHVFALEIEDGQAVIRAVRIDRWGPASFVEISTVDRVELPAIPSGTPSLALVAGSPSVLLPFGVDAPAWALRSTGDRVVLDSLAELECDALALAQPGPDGEGDSPRLACLAEGQLRLGWLGIE
ncbi:MAG: hypothetical protein R6X02_26390 [Enhygromyxa sp.]